MWCGLKHALGVEAPCEGCACTYWRSADTESGLPQGCALVHYALVGSTADATTRWLYDYKLSVERTQFAAYLNSRTFGHIAPRRRRVGVAGAA